MERLPEPASERHREPSLPARDDVGGQVAERVALEEDLRRQAADPLLDGQRRGELHDRLVEKGGAELEGRAHARPVGLRQEPLREGGLEVEPLEDVEDLSVWTGVFRRVGLDAEPLEEVG
jgi:hypothetical protein